MKGAQRSVKPSEFTLITSTSRGTSSQTALSPLLLVLTSVSVTLSSMRVAFRKWKMCL